MDGIVNGVAIIIIGIYIVFAIGKIWESENIKESLLSTFAFGIGGIAVFPAAVVLATIAYYIFAGIIIITFFAIIIGSFCGGL